MKKKAGNIKKLFITIFLLFVVFSSVQITMLIFADVRELSEMNCKIEKYEKEIKNLENKKEDIKSNIVRINENTEIEKIARDKLNLVKEGETVYKLAK